jgi:uracil-DNA glycosylase family 4
MPLVPNLFPTIPDSQGRRLAVVGEAPGEAEEVTGEPFVGPSGKLLRAVLSHSGILPQSCFFGNICQHRPHNNEIETFDWQGPEIQSGLATLNEDLHTFRPNCVLALGRTAFRYFRPDKCYQGKPSKSNPSGYVIPLQDWRGSIFESVGGLKVVACFHPAYIQRAFGDIAYFRNDVGRAVRHAGYRDIRATARTGALRPNCSEVLAFLADIRDRQLAASFDIEGYSDAIGVTMLSICPTPTSGIVIPFYIDGTPYWSEEEEALVWSALSAWLADPRCPKKCHNAFYETLVLGWRHSCVVDGIISDTMMKQWEFYNELEKSLAVATSLWTEEPYYKDDRESSNSNVKLLYNFKDSACTEEVDRAIEPALRRYPGAYSHYEFNVSLIPCFTYLHLRGCRFDTVRAAAHRKTAEQELEEIIGRIDRVTLPILGHSFNPKSTTDKQWLLYDFLGHTPYKRYGTTTKEEVMLRFYNKRKDPVLLDLIRAVNLRTRISDIEKLAPSSDGRLRTAYNLVATNTGRSGSSETSIAEIFYTPKGKVGHNFDGTNLQNVTKSLRDVCIPDGDDYTFFQADLKGADAWTVAADLAALGHPRMLEDLIAGVKPPKLLLRMLEVIEAGGDPSVIARLNSQDALAECAKVIIPTGMLPDGRPADWKNVTMKRVQHGSNYLGREDTISATIFKDSDGLIDVPPSEVARYQALYKLRYNLDARTQWMQQHLVKTGGVLEYACGIRRRFFGIRNPTFIDEDIIRQALASEPQGNTTYCTNLALKRMWYDPDNRRKSGALFVEPLLQVHDALAGQFPTRLLDFATKKLHWWFDNELTIHGIKVKIPVDLKFGRNWGTV